ncbi:MAG: protein kinase [Ktedonobacteraceae bacterium]|nr:protein kinase [Ktedonobacteraceae bacterium]
MPQNDARLVGGIYRVGQVLSSGAALTTCTAYNRNTNDVVGLTAIELPPGSYPSLVQPYLNMLEQRRKIQSPHVLRVHHWGFEGSRMYIVTDPPRGTTLQHVMDNENTDLRRSLELIKQLTEGLRILHAQRIGGLDLRPQLITVDQIGVNDRVQIDDFGLRTLLRHLGYINGQSTGDIGYLDPRYAPPEYINNGQIGPWSDIYQLGLLLFTLVTGRLPFVGHNPAETGIMQSNAPVPYIARLAHETPQELQEVVEKAMSKAPAQRFSNILTFIAALESIPLPLTRRTPELTTQESHTGPQAAQQPSTALTLEMTLIDDVSRISTQLEGFILPQPTGESRSLTGQALAEEKEVYAYLRYEKDGRAVHRFPITGKHTIIGRHDPKRGLTPDIDLSVLDPKMTVSRQHARIHYEETFFYIEDIKSRNKTRLGELTLIPMKAELLQHGDTITFGSVRLRFEVPGQPPLKRKTEQDLNEQQ